MPAPQPTRVHLICGGFPVGSSAGHDMDFARRRILKKLGATPDVVATVGNDFSDIEKWLPGCRLLITYTAGPFANDAESAFLEQWLAAGGKWFALHGSSGGKAVKKERAGATVKQMVKTSHHHTLGSFFLNHPPLRRFEVSVRNPHHPLTRDLPPSFEVVDELYLIELQQPAESDILLTTELARDPSPPGFGFVYDQDTALLEDGKTRVLGYVKQLGKGGVAYVALGHCHAPSTNPQRFVDTSAMADGERPLNFRGAWDGKPFDTLLGNGIAWGVQ